MPAGTSRPSNPSGPSRLPEAQGLGQAEGARGRMETGGGGGATSTFPASRLRLPLLPPAARALPPLSARIPCGRPFHSFGPGASRQSRLWHRAEVIAGSAQRTGATGPQGWSSPEALFRGLGRPVLQSQVRRDELRSWESAGSRGSAEGSLSNAVVRV